ncbi:basic membrane lipoprotein Med (substrate-binding protein (PBP1-ABC) superfamily) [Aminobacter niigataensis]|uniref:Basic membrane lipoprotein Med (Substrate-binding protein (PBP1-ABC) superfamily) n=1 Tax=Aminobacter niigataensis TaxID=83265 RepID=A0ABR6L5J3_9HYPH|nr:BMP family ABC transporter substrate-binding protein [Aminobacter niigataensis]MBB4652070.1 basic membrane lipoprotein Med (substrate-binding protein (PBP1-ABC) superfamily) [Aminobacter niigataensis]
MADAAFKLSGPAKIALVIFTNKNDGGWSQALDEARQRMEKEMGVSIPVIENVPENATAVRPAVELLIQRGYNVIIGSAFGYSDTFKELAAKYPEVAFLNPAGTTNGPNLESFYGRTYESQYLCGMAAAGASKSGKLGFVAANPFGLVNWTVNAYAMGARQVNPNATVTVVFTGAWNDPVKERAAAEALTEQGIDVIGQHVDTPAVQLVAQEKGIYSTGHHRDLAEFAPKATQCSSVWVWDRFLVPEIKKIEAGNWEPGPYGAFLSIKEGGTDVSCCGDAVAQAVADKVVAARQAIVDGKLQVYAGPLKDRDGKERVPAGAVLSDADLWAMDWYVPGVVSQQ